MPRLAIPRTLPDVLSSKVIRAVRTWATNLEGNGGRRYIAGVSHRLSDFRQP